MSSSQPTGDCVRRDRHRFRHVVYAACFSGFLLLSLVALGWVAPLVQTRGGTDAPEAIGLETGPFRQPLFSPQATATCWTCLPERVRGEKGPLPLWARTLARSLPQTTAAMLELDYLHRAGSALSPKLRGTLRWAAARASGCSYGEAVAISDLRAAGVGEDYLTRLSGDSSGWPEEMRAAIAFAMTLSRTPQEVTDDEVAQLVRQYGEKELVAIVLLLAHANFQDRLLLALKIEPEPDGPVPPLNVKFARRLLGAVALVPPRRDPSSPPGGEPEWLDDPLGGRLDAAGIQAALSRQRCRIPRIRLPDAGVGVNRWGQVGQTYQPELAAAWSACTQAFGEESDQDPIFEQSLFWLVTRTKRCFY